MEELASEQFWLVLLGVAVGAFLLGRASSGSNAEARERRRLEEEQEVESALTRVAPSKLAEIDRLLADRKKIEAIKLLREQTGLGLKASKLAGERRGAQQGVG
jgi:ribosomal protein L7/L12